jgi:hypothetical protein
MSIIYAILGVSCIYTGTLLLFRKQHNSEVSELKNLISSLRQEIHLLSTANRKLELDISYLNEKSSLKSVCVPKEKPMENKIVKKRGRRPGWNRNK